MNLLLEPSKASSRKSLRAQQRESLRLCSRLLSGIGIEWRQSFAREKKALGCTGRGLHSLDGNVAPRVYSQFSYPRTCDVNMITSHAKTIILSLSSLRIRLLLNSPLHDRHNLICNFDLSWRHASTSSADQRIGTTSTGASMTMRNPG